MLLSPRIALVRNLAVATFNGAVTLMILLIAPMGLAGVISNTLIVTIASFLNATACDRVVLFLQASNNSHRPQSNAEFDLLKKDRDSSDIKRD